MGHTVVVIRAGTFLMGSTPDAPDRGQLEFQREVTLTRNILMHTTEVTQAQWRAVMGELPRGLENPGCDTCPMTNVNWFEAASYANALSRREGLAETYLLETCQGELGGEGLYTCESVRWSSTSPYLAQGWRLPTEAEWEYACRAGRPTPWFFGTDASLADDFIWHQGNSDGRPHPVGQKQPNAWGLYDMAGNVSEWCEDGITLELPAGAGENPVEGLGSPYKVSRGGSWYGNLKFARSAARRDVHPGGRWGSVGFRLVRTLR
ncbi:MAG: formylglycine-generating enzyme family protein [Candidatus Sericytochromatia bacterium]|nr:formylglycine-generating enzyme family protein [Candidatus Sericytochromatia bacterium]